MAAAQSGLLELTELAVETRHGARIVLVAQPRDPMVLDRARLESMRAGDFTSKVDGELMRALADVKHEVHALVFRARSDQPTSWAFAADLTEGECNELGYFLVRSQLALYRRLMQAGVFGLIGIEFGQRELAGLHRGAERLAAELERELSTGTHPDRAAVVRLDLWLIDHLALWSPMSFDDLRGQRLADAIVASERQAKHAEQLLGRVPDGALG